MAAEGGNKLLSTVRRKGHREVVEWKIGRTEDAECPRCREEEETPDHSVFRCRNVKRVGWEDSDDEGRPVLKRVDLMEEFFGNIHRQIRTACTYLKTHDFSVRGYGGGTFIVYIVIFLGLALGLEGSAHGLAIGISCMRVMNKNK